MTHNDFNSAGMKAMEFKWELGKKHRWLKWKGEISFLEFTIRIFTVLQSFGKLISNRIKIYFLQFPSLFLFSFTLGFGALMVSKFQYTIELY